MIFFKKSSNFEKIIENIVAEYVKVHKISDFVKKMLAFAFKR